MLMMNSVYFPGTTWSIWGIAVAVACISILIGVLRSMFNMSLGSIGHYGKGGNNQNIKISKDRQGDTK